MPNGKPQERISLVEWWKQSNDKLLSESVERATAKPNELGPFVTTLVERLSAIGRDTLAERFGQPARDRLVRLHDLARFDIADEQVRADTRRTFAANRLVQAWLPEDREEATADLSAIRQSIAYVLSETPWKFSLWRAVVRAAARRLPQPDDNEDDDRTAEDWLVCQLRKVTMIPSPKSPSEAWLCNWPEECIDTVHDRTSGALWRSRYVSFHRAIFWKELAEVVRVLWAYHARTNPLIIDRYYAGPTPSAWVVRAIPTQEFGHVAKWLGTLDKWVEVLYPEDRTQNSLISSRWELDQFVVAVLSSCQQSDLAKSWQECEESSELLMVPESLQEATGSATWRLLKESGRIQPHTSQSRPLDRLALAHVQLGSQDQRLGPLLFPPNESPKVDDAKMDWNQVASASISLNCAVDVHPHLTLPFRQEIQEIENMINRFSKDPLALIEYGNVRRIQLAIEDSTRISVPTLHCLLWGPTSHNQPFSSWRIRPWEVPAVGLPTRVAIHLFVNIQKGGECFEFETIPVPLTWELLKHCDGLTLGRCLQFGFDRVELTTFGSFRPSLQRSREWGIPPHQAYFLPFINSRQPADVDRVAYSSYCDVLLLITALDGGESILDQIAKYGAGSIPFEDRWHWRSRLHLPTDAWREMEKIIRWSGRPSSSVEKEMDKLIESLNKWTPQALTLDDFRLEKVDIRLDKRSDIELSRSVLPIRADEGEIPEALLLDRDCSTESLVVRIGQVAHCPDRAYILSKFPAIVQPTANRIMEQVARVFQAPKQGQMDQEPDLVLIPEVSIPQPEIGTVRDLVASTGRASLAGLYWRVLPPVYRLVGGPAPSMGWFVNEAELAVPMNYNDRGPTVVRTYRVRKPLPSHLEAGLASSLSQEAERRTHWQILKGQRWYRFVHPTWGDFSVAICADLLDSAPWRSLRGELLHLFVVAFNQDIELYESLTWVRAYESYLNLVAVNHGEYGGSFLWTPRRSSSREIARLRGGNLFLVADVGIPVQSLIDRQLCGVTDAVSHAQERWSGNESTRSEFKSPPPGFVRRAITAKSES